MKVVVASVFITLNSYFLAPLRTADIELPNPAKFTCSTLSMETLEKGVKYVQS